MVLNRFGHSLADVEREHILETLNACDGNRTRTARLLDISLRCLRMKLHRFGHAGPDPGERARPLQAVQGPTRGTPPENDAAAAETEFVCGAGPVRAARPPSAWPG